MSQASDSAPLSRIPRHVAVIMDGNGRWATSRGLPRVAGHRAGTENLRRIIRSTVEFGIEYLTLYSFSTENWGRPREEIDGLMLILEDVIDRELAELNREGVRLLHLGHLDPLPQRTQQKVRHAMELTASNRRLTVNLAFNYGGRDELVCAIQKIIRSGVPAEAVTPELVSESLFTAGTPDPDLIIRTSGEYRTSNFLIWQGAYAEWYFTPTLWPDFDRAEYHTALQEFGKRNRRFGRVENAVQDQP